MLFRGRVIHRRTVNSSVRAITTKKNIVFDDVVFTIVGGDKTMHFDDINLDKNYTPSGAYGRSKLANILFTAELAKRLSGKYLW